MQKAYALFLSNTGFSFFSIRTMLKTILDIVKRM